MKVVKKGKRLVAYCLSMLALATLTACGGGGGGGGGGAGNGLFVADGTSEAIWSTSSTSPSALRGFAPQAPATALSAVDSLALDSAGDILYVANGSQLVAFDKAGSLKSYVTPRVIYGNQTTVLSLDETAHRLFAGYNDTINVFDAVAATDNHLTPDRTISLSDMDSIREIAVDVSRNLLYVYGYDTVVGRHEVHVYQNASTLNTAASATRSIDLLGTCVPTSGDGMLLDEATDTLYVACQRTLRVLTTAHSADGTVAVTPGTALSGNRGARLAADFSAGVLYIVTGPSLFAYPSMGAATGAQYDITTNFGAAYLTAVAVRQ